MFANRRYKVNNMKYFLLVILAAIIGFGVADKYFPSTNIVRITDTIIVVTEPIILEKITPKLIYRSDTVIVTNPFIAIIDTVYKADTIQVSYLFPENEMSIAIKMATDTIYNQRIEPVVCNESKWWETPAIATCGLIIGFLISNTSK